MLDRLAGSNPAKPPETAGGEFQAPSGFVVGDFTHRQVELRWETVGKSTGYNVYRATTSGGPYGEGQRVNSNPVTTTTFVDDKLNPGKEYFYVVRVVSPSGAESANSTEIGITTAKTPPPCDPYFSLDRNSPVTKNGAPTTQTCRWPGAAVLNLAQATELATDLAESGQAAVSETAKAGRSHARKQA
jgi:Fibronectin type III domain